MDAHRFNEKVGTKIQWLIRNVGLAEKDIKKLIAIPSTTFWMWRKGQQTMNFADAEYIARFFSVKIKDLVIKHSQDDKNLKPVLNAKAIRYSRSDFNNRVGPKICWLREKKGITRKNMEGLMGIPLTTIWRWENSKQTISFPDAWDIAILFNVTVDDLVSDIPNK